MGNTDLCYARTGPARVSQSLSASASVRRGAGRDACGHIYPARPGPARPGPARTETEVWPGLRRSADCLMRALVSQTLTELTELYSVRYAALQQHHSAPNVKHDII